MLITVPHAKCEPGNPHHSCDSHAQLLADSLMEVAQNLSLDAKMIVGDTNRDTCDLNRKTCQVTPAKKEMIGAIKSGHHKILLDAHSYPHKWPADNSIFPRNSAAFKHNVWDADMFFIVNEHDKRSQQFFAEVMDDVRRENSGLDLRCLCGTSKLNLIHEASSAKMFAVLIEAGEHLTTQQVKSLALAIVTSAQKKSSSLPIA